MADWVHRTTKQYLVSVSPVSLPEVQASYIKNPDLSAVTGQPNKYWLITGDVITLMDQTARDAVDASALIVNRDAEVSELDRLEGVLRAFMLTVLDEFNLHADKHNAILDAIDGASNLSSLKSTIAAIANYPPRTTTQLRTSIRNKLGT